MEQKIKTGPQDVFFHLLGLVTLIINVVSFISLLFQYVNALFPDQLTSYYSYTQGYSVMRTAISSLLIVWPVYILTAWLIRKEEKKHIEKHELSMKKWLTYLILFVAAITIIIDLITLVNNFLGGDLTIQFALKVLVVLITASVVFGYYIWELKKGKPTAKLPRLAAIAVSALILIAMVAGFFVIGTPKEQRARRFDEQRVEQLQAIQSQIINYWSKKQILPEKLSDLTDDISGFRPETDPVTHEPYTYTVKGDLTFELCAEFQTEKQDTESMMYKPYYFEENWNHGIGKHCFERTIDPELYKDTGTLVPTVIR